MANIWFEAGVIAFTSIGSGVLALFILWRVLGRSAAPQLTAVAHPALEETVFLFDDEVLVDASGPARALLEATPMGASDWARLSAFVAPRFRDFSAQMASLSEHGRLEMTAKETDAGLRPLQLLAENVNGLARITLSDPNAEGIGKLVDSLSQCALEDELEMISANVEPCIGGKSLGENTDIRVFSVEHIKGLEFEAVFFVGVDQLSNLKPDLFAKYLYVGVTRAASYLGMTCNGSLPEHLDYLRDQCVHTWA